MLRLLLIFDDSLLERLHVRLLFLASAISSSCHLHGKRNAPRITRFLLTIIIARPSKRYCRQHIWTRDVNCRNKVSKSMVFRSSRSHLHRMPDSFLLGFDCLRTYVVFGWQDCPTRLFEQAGVCVRDS